MQDFKECARCARAVDRFEARHALGMTIGEALRVTYFTAKRAHVARVAGALVAVFGVEGSMLQGRACIWLVGTQLLDQYPVQFVKQTRQYLDQWRADYGRLFNWVAAINKRTRRWLQFAGFEIGAPAPYGPYKTAFCYFEG
jgi:hypothetical protein